MANIWRQAQKADTGLIYMPLKHGSQGRKRLKAERADAICGNFRHTALDGTICAVRQSLMVTHCPPAILGIRGFVRSIKADMLYVGTRAIVHGDKPVDSDIKTRG